MAQWLGEERCGDTRKQRNASSLVSIRTSAAVVPGIGHLFDRAENRTIIV